MYFVALTPTLSQREREPLGPRYCPLALWERARVRGRLCYDVRGFKVFETASMPCSYRERRSTD
jgi:hypothetical protein